MKELAKICPNCGKQNKITAKFCEECGTTSSDVTSPPKAKEGSKSSGGVIGFWNKRSTKGKAGIGIVGICCLGLILIVGIAGLMSPDKIAVSNDTKMSNTIQNDTPTTNNSTATSNNNSVTSNNVYSDKYIQFTIPDGYYVTDNSTGDYYDIQIYKKGWFSTDFIGEITRSNEDNGWYQNEKIGGYPAYASHTTEDTYDDIKVSDSNYILIDLDMSVSSSDYDTIIKSFQIK